MVTGLAGERESKAREGMKMMGLNDKTYFAGWFVFMGGLIMLMSAILVLTASQKTFLESNLWLIWALGVFYGMTLYGFSFIVVAFLQTKKSSATVATLLHILSFYLAFAFRGPAWSNSVKMWLSLIPNCALCFSVEHLFHCEMQGSGMSLEFAN
jgi:hypothetical protein